MNGVRARDNENIERVLKKFSRVCEHAGVLKEVKKFQFYEKPSAKRKREHNAAVRKRMRDERNATEK
jgi:small subunit ribosomal protein S21